MTQSFDELWQQYKRDDTRFNIDVAKSIYESVAQSRQAEVDELKATIVKYEAGLRKNKANKHKLLGKNIELQKRIECLEEVNESITDELVCYRSRHGRDELQKRIDKALIQISNHYYSCVARKSLKQMSASISEIAEIEAHEASMVVLENILKGKENE